MSDTAYVIGFKTTNGEFVPLAWSDTKISVKQLRKVTHSFRNDSDFLEPYQTDYSRFYHTKTDMLTSLPSLWSVE